MNMDIAKFYDKIANEFDKTRIRLWNCVTSYLNLFPSNSYILDIGCGNGKYMTYRNDLIFKGIDLSNELVKICCYKKLDVIQGDMCNLPYDNDLFDGLLVVASYHHLNNDIDRQKSLNEMYRVLKKNGLCLIVVWALEQEENKNKNLNNLQKNDNYIKWTCVQTGEVLYRYYNIYSKYDLYNEIKKLKPEFNIINFDYEKGNYYIIVQKL